MKKILHCVVLLISTINCYTQTNFKNGYFINNQGNKQECLIKNIDWKNNPTEFTYKISKEGNTKVNSIRTVKEFGIYNTSKYIRKQVQIDKSINLIDRLSENRRPNFKTEELFLKVLIEGKANLFSFEANNIKVFFYSTSKKPISQLVFKKYLVTKFLVGKNERYKQQLINNLKCNNLSIDEAKNVNYNSKQLTKYFIKYNNCNNSKIINFSKTNDNKKKFGLSVQLGFNSNTLNIDGPSSSDRGIDFGGKIGLRLGLEGEYILPFNNNKWGIVISPTYQSFKSSTTTSNNNVPDNFLVANTSYKSIEVPIGVRHSFYLNTMSKIYITGSYVLDFSLNSFVDFNRIDGTNLGRLKINTSNSFAFGLGYKYNKYNIEFRYNNRNILGSLPFWSSNYSSLSVNFGYSFL